MQTNNLVVFVFSKKTSKQKNPTWAISQSNIDEPLQKHN